MYTKRARIDSLEGREEEDERERETERYGTIHFDNRVTFLFFLSTQLKCNRKKETTPVSRQKDKSGDAPYS